MGRRCSRQNKHEAAPGEEIPVRCCLSGKNSVSLLHRNMQFSSYVSLYLRKLSRGQPMSKEATGENGAVLGSSEYWNRINCAAFFGRLMQRPAETNYHETLREVGNRAGAAVEEIYDDLQEHINAIRNMSSDRRSALVKQVQSLYDVCRMSGSFCSHSSDCIGILNLSSFYLPGSSFRDDRATQTAIQKLRAVQASLPVSVLICFKRLWIGVFPLRQGAMQERLHSSRIFHRERIKNSYEMY